MIRICRSLILIGILNSQCVCIFTPVHVFYSGRKLTEDTVTYRGQR